ncbi:hypothetical protein, partial [Streptosporangium lutulentum]
VSVAAAVTAIAAAVNLGGPGADVTTGVVDKPRDPYERLAAENPPAGAPMVIEHPLGDRSTRAWFTERTAAGGGTFYVFCQVTQEPYGASEGACDQRPKPESPSAQAWYEGGTIGTLPRPAIGLGYGAARENIAKVDVVDQNGTRAVGQMYRSANVPLAIWSVVFPSKAGVIRLEFFDDRGKVVERVRLEVPRVSGDASGRRPAPESSQPVPSRR